MNGYTFNKIMFDEFNDYKYEFTKKEKEMATYRGTTSLEELTEVTGAIDVEEKEKQLIQLPLGCVVTKMREKVTNEGEHKIKISYRFLTKLNENFLIDELKLDDVILYLISEGSTIPEKFKGGNELSVFNFAGKDMYAFIK